MIKVLQCRFQQFLGPFGMLTVQRRSETELFSHLPNHFFCSLYIWQYISYETHVFFQIFQNLLQISEIKQKIEKELFPYEIIAFELIAVNSHYYKESTCDQHSQRELRFKISLRETFPNSIFLGIVIRYYKSAAVQISAVLRTLQHVDCPTMFSYGAFQTFT